MKDVLITLTFCFFIAQGILGQSTSNSVELENWVKEELANCAIGTENGGTSVPTPSLVDLTRPVLEHPNGWWWPAGISTFGQFLPWLGPNSNFPCPSTGDPQFHLAQDMSNPQNDPVYAVDVGDVIYASNCVGGYGGPNGQTCGGAIVIQHRAKDGTWFTALYGHLNTPVLPVNSRIFSGDQIVGHSNNWNPPHVHFGIRPGFDPPPVLSPYTGYTCSTNTLYGFVNPISFLSNNAACKNGSSVNFRPNNGPPVHPNGSFIKTASNPTAYLLQNGQKRAISDVTFLRNLYPNGGFDHNHVIVVAQDELNSYPTGAIINSTLPSNGRTHSEGRLIKRASGGEISIVTDNGMRRPFVSSTVFTDLGYLFCNVVDATNGDYDSYPEGAPVTGSASSSCPSPMPISVGQTINGTLQSGDCLLPSDGSYYDAYTFSGTAGQQIYITLNSTQFNAFLFLYQGNFPGGTQVMSDNNGGGGTNARIPPSSGFVTLPASGTYTILANSFSAGETGSYSLFLGGPTCNPPGSFSLSSPTNGQNLSSTNSVTLSWAASANADSYDVYFGTNANPPLLANQAGTSRVVSVTPGQTYFWRVVAKVNCSSSTSSTPTWSFAVQTSCNSPGSFSLNSPANGQNVSSMNSITLSWGSSANADSYDVYFGTNSNPPFLANQIGTSRVVSVTPGQSYWWRVVAKVNCSSATSSSSTWSFSVQTATCTYSLNPTGQNFPANGGSNSFQVNTQPGCSWTAVPEFSDRYRSGSEPNWWSLSPAIGLFTPVSEPTEGSTPSPEADFAGTGTGPIPDATTGPQVPGTPLNISFAVTGLGGTPTNVEVSMTGTHSFVGDLKAILIAPNGNTFTVFGYTGALSGTDFGSPSDLSGTYRFQDSASGSNWWTAAGSTPVPVGNYRTTVSGPTSNPAAVTNLTGAFSGVTNPNGTWVLRVTDGAPQDTGSITAATLTLTAGSGSNWINITSGSSGTGNGTVDYSVTGNSSSSPRTGRVRVNSEVHTINQAGTSGCNYSLPNPPTNTVGPGNGGGSFALSTSSGCSWTATSDSPSWLTTSSSGTGSSPVGYSFTANNTSNTRVGNILVGGQAYTVTQIGLGGAGSVQFTSGNYSVDESGVTATITVIRSSGIATGTVSFSTANGTATAGLDYTATPVFLLFAEGVTSRTVEIPIHEDVFVEGNETIHLSLTNASNSLTMGSPNAAVLTIVDNDFSPPGHEPFDYDGDGRVDFSVFRPTTGAWYLQRTTAGFFGVQFGSNSDRLTPADYDGDGKTDIAVYRPSTGTWFILRSSNGTVDYPVFGAAEDLPAPGDYDGDGKADPTVFRPSQGTWYRTNSSNGTTFGMQFGANGDVPTVGDFDGDGKNDLGIWRPSNGDWYNIRSSNGSVFGERFGQTGDKIAPADYDGDGKTDITIYRPSTGLWVVRNSATATYSYYVFGAASDVPVAGDYDGDGKADIGVWRPSDGTWYIQRSSNSQFIVFPWGQNGDRPTPSAYGN